MGRECLKCHLPKPERAYDSPETGRCITCTNKQQRRDSRQQIGSGGANSSSRANNNAGECSALDGFARTKRFSADNNTVDLLVFLNDIQNSVISYLQNCIDELRACKYYMCIHVRMFRVSQDSEIIRVDPHLRCNAQIGLSGSDLENDVITCFRDLLNYLELFNAEGSGWIIESIDYLDVFVGKYNPLAGSGLHNTLPKKLLSKRAVLNICSNDTRCFQYAVLASLYPGIENYNRTSSYTQYINKLDWSNISFPTALHQISTFEKRNNLAINIYGWEDDTTFPIRITSNRYAANDRFVNLLLINIDDNEMHYCCIRCMSRLTSTRSKSHHKNYICHYCLHPFTKRSLLDQHFTHCQRQQPQTTSLPKAEHSIVKFKNYKNSIPVPFVIYIDLESLLIPVDNEDQCNRTTVKHQNHQTCGWAMYVVCTHPDLHDFKPKIYRGIDAMDKLLKELKDAEREIIRILDNIVPATLSPEQWVAYDNATHCHICNKLLDDSDSRCVDHDHLTGEFRGAAHRSCNLSYKGHKTNNREKHSHRIPVFCHNLASYDAHLIMQSIGKNSRDELSCLAFNFEKYLTFTCGNLQFIDTIYFLNKSLSGLVDELKADGVHNFGHVRKVFPNDDLFDLVLRKLPYCYDYLDSYDKFAETTLPPREAFYNKLTNSDLSEEDYVLVQTVWEKFNLRTLGDFHNLRHIESYAY